MASKVFIKNNIKLQQKDSPFNIGIDVKAYDINIIGEKHNQYYKSINYIEYDTQIYIDSLRRNSEEQLYTLVYPRSSLSNKNLLLCNSVGLIDPNYRDSIKLRFKYIAQPKDFVSVYDSIFINVDLERIYNIGDKIGQLVFVNSVPVNIEYVPDLMPSDRIGGFGSTGE
jgi:dUTPase